MNIAVGILILSACATLINILILYFYNSSVNPHKVVPSETLDVQPQNIAYRSGVNRNTTTLTGQSGQEIVVMLVSCGSRYTEAFNAIKSAILFTSSPLKFIIFTEENVVAKFKDVLGNWQQKTNSFSFELYVVTYPISEDAAEWKKLLVPCASQRLFFPSILTDIDAALYVDTDTLFTSPLEEIWGQFSLMNSTQEVAMVTECDLPFGGYYEVMAKHPYYKPGGLNSGVMLMNMTRMRQSHWTREIVKYYKEYKHLLHSGDQDLINIYLYFHPDRVRVLNTRYNFRPHKTYCDESLGVREAAESGAAILHGTGGSFYHDHFHSHMDISVYQTLAELWTEHELGYDPYVNLYLPLKYHMGAVVNEVKCDSYYRIFTAGMKTMFNTTWK